MEKLQDYMLLFRFVPDMQQPPTAEYLAEQKKMWGSWIGSIAAQAKLVSTHQLGFAEKRISADMQTTDGMAVYDSAIVGGNMVIKATDIGEAADIAKGCPILTMGGNVEIREILER